MEEIVETGKRELRGEGNGGRTGRGEEWRNLVADVEDLVKKVANVDDEEIAEIRSKVQHTLERAKTSAPRTSPRRPTCTCARIPGPRSASRLRSASSSDSSPPGAADPPPAEGVLPMRSLIGHLVPAVLRHLEAYAEVAGEDARDAAATIARRLLALLAAAACGFVAILMLCAVVLALAWDRPWRVWAAAGLALGFAAIPALRRGETLRTLFFPRIRSELSRDRELLERAFDGRERAVNGGEHATD